MVAIKKPTLTIAQMAAKGKTMMDGPKPRGVTTSSSEADITRASTFFGFGGTLEWVTPDVLSLIYIDLLRIYAPECGGTQEEYDELRQHKRILDTIAR